MLWNVCGGIEESKCFPESMFSELSLVSAAVIPKGRFKI